MDITNSLRAGSTALHLASDLVSSGNYNIVLVVSGDTRVTKPGSPDEFLYSHGGAAILLGSNDNSIATIKGKFSYSTSQVDNWRLTGDRFPLSGDLHFSRSGAFFKPMNHILSKSLESQK